MPHIKTRASALYDLLFHCIAGVPIAPDDVSRLGDRRYLALVDGWPLDDSLRTLPADAQLLADLYARAPAAHALQGLASLYDDVAELVRDAHSPFAELQFEPAWRQRLAQAIGRAVATPLLELFRVAVWAEERAGFCDQMAMERAAHRDDEARLDRAFSEAAGCFPELFTAELFSCPALVRCGRLLNPAGRLVIAVGAPWPELSLDPWHAVIQGCHELMLDSVLRRLASAGTRDGSHRAPPVPGSERNPVQAPPAAVETKTHSAGFAQHLRAEGVATALLAHRCLAGPCEEAYRSWWAASSPAGWARLLRSLPWTPADLEIPEDVGLIELIAAGAFVAPDLRSIFTALL